MQMHFLNPFTSRVGMDAKNKVSVKVRNLSSNPLSCKSSNFSEFSSSALHLVM